MFWFGLTQHFPLSLAAAVASAAVGFYSLRRSQGRPERAQLARILFLTAVWTSFSFSTSWTKNPDTTALIARLIYAVAAWVPFAFCRLVLVLLPSPHRGFNRFVWCIGATSVAFSVLAFHPAIISGVRDVGGVHAVLPGPFFGFFVAHSLLGMGLAFLPLFAGPKSLEGIARNKLKYFTLGFFVAFLGAGIHFYSGLTGSEPFPHDLLILFFATCLFFGLWNPSRDINEILRRFLAHALFGVGLGLPIGVVLWGLGAGFNITALVLLVVVLSPPLFLKWRESLYSFVDRLPILRGKFIPPELLAREVTVVEAARNVNEWARRVVRAGQELFGARSASVLLRQEDMGAFLIKAGVGLTPGEMGLLSLPFDSAVVAQLETSRQCLLAEPLEALPQGGRGELDDLRFVHARAIAPLFSTGQLVALVCVGPKGTGEIFNQSDVVVLSGLARSAQYALSAVLAGQSRHQQSAVWAHDMVKPFGPKGGIGNVERVLRGDFGPLSPDQQKALARAADDATFVAKHLKNILDQAGDEPTSVRPSSLASAYAHSQARFSLHAEEQGLTLTVDAPPTDLLVLCDALLIEYRVISNLMENALRHTPRGGKVRLGYRVEENSFVGFVEDSGPGIKEEDLSRLFEPGTQLDPTKKGLAGLGLSSVKSVVESYGGRVWVESELGKGSTFSLFLPLNRK